MEYLLYKYFMNELSTILSNLPASTPPIVLNILVLFFMYKKIGTDRQETKLTRDKDSQELHDDVLKLKFKVTELQGRSQNHSVLLDDLRAQMALLNINIAKISVLLENYMKNEKI